jgi:hypothetical protein
VGYNNRIYFLRVTARTGTDSESKACNDANKEDEYVLKAGGKVPIWKRIRTEAEVAGMLLVSSYLASSASAAYSSDLSSAHAVTPTGNVTISKLYGYSSTPRGNNVSIPWEWVLTSKSPGTIMTQVWKTLSYSEKLEVVERLAHFVTWTKKNITPKDLDIQKERQIGSFALNGPDFRAHIDSHAGSGSKPHSQTEKDVSEPIALPPSEVEDRAHDQEFLTLRSRITIGQSLHSIPPSSTFLTDAILSLSHQVEKLRSPPTNGMFVNQLQLAYLPRLEKLLSRLKDLTTSEGASARDDRGCTVLDILKRVNEDPRWAPVFTHGDFQPQNILIDIQHTDTTPSSHSVSSSSSDARNKPQRRVEITVLDWEWSGFFPPHVEWDAGLSNLLDFLSSSSSPSSSPAPDSRLHSGSQPNLDSDSTATLEGSSLKERFLSILHHHSVLTPPPYPLSESAPESEDGAEGWKTVMNLLRLTELVVPWWLQGYEKTNEDGKTESKGASEGQYEEDVLQKRDGASQELDSLLGFFEGI